MSSLAGVVAAARPAGGALLGSCPIARALLKKNGSTVRFGITTCVSSSQQRPSQPLIGQRQGVSGGVPSLLEGRKVGSALRSFRHGLTVKAVNVSGPGTVDSPLISSMQSKIKEELNADKVTVKDAYGDGRHVSIDVVAAVFEGKSSVSRQRMVYKVIWQELQETVHAVDILRTRTPDEAANSPDL